MGPISPDISFLLRSSTLTTVRQRPILRAFFFLSSFSFFPLLAHVLLPSFPHSDSTEDLLLWLSVLYSLCLCGQGQLAGVVLVNKFARAHPRPAKHTYTHIDIHKVATAMAKGRQTSKSGVVFSSFFALDSPFCLARPTNSQHPYAHMQVDM